MGILELIGLKRAETNRPTRMRGRIFRTSLDEPHQGRMSMK